MTLDYNSCPQVRVARLALIFPSSLSIGITKARMRLVLCDVGAPARVLYYLALEMGRPTQIDPWCRIRRPEN